MTTLLLLIVRTHPLLVRLCDAAAEEVLTGVIIEELIVVELDPRSSYGIPAPAKPFPLNPGPSIEPIFLAALPSSEKKNPRELYALSQVTSTRDPQLLHFETSSW